MVSVSAGPTQFPYALWALRSGCFAAHGLEVTLETSSSDTFRKVAALAGGSIDIASDGLVEVARFASSSNNSLELRVISNGYGFSKEQLEQAKSAQLVDGNLVLETVLLGQPGRKWTEISDLVGRSVALSASGNTAEGLRIAMRDSGLDLGETEFVDLGSSEREVAFERGDVDFVMLTGQQARTQLARGATLVLYPGAYIYLPGSVLTYYTTQSTIDEKTEEIAAFQRAIAEMNQWLSEPGDIDSFRDFLINELDYDPDVAQDFMMPNFSLGTPNDKLITDYGLLLYQKGVIPSPTLNGLSTWNPSN